MPFSAAGACCECFTPSIMDEVVLLTMKKDRLSEVNMNMMAIAVVSLCRKDVAPVLPKTAWLEPPKTAPMLAPFPFCKRTMRMRAIQAKTCTKMRI